MVESYFDIFTGARYNLIQDPMYFYLNLKAGFVIAKDGDPASVNHNKKNPYAFEKGKWYNFQLKRKDYEVELFINKEKIIGALAKHQADPRELTIKEKQNYFFALFMDSFGNKVNPNVDRKRDTAFKCNTVLFDNLLISG